MPNKISITELAALLVAKAKDRRLLMAMAGPPGSGKSTLAARLVNTLNNTEPGLAALLPMDGYHFDDQLLKQLGRLNRKGAPDTFDVGGLKHMLGRLQKNTDDAIVIPEFDRNLEIARAGSRLIPSDTRIIIVEGNYLLLNQPPWDALAPFFDLTVMLETNIDVLRQRLTRRWFDQGLGAEEVARKLDENDIPNGLIVRENSTQADFVQEN